MARKEIVVVGAGLAGGLLAIYLARRGYSVKLFEKRPDMRVQNIPAGRSINLSLSARGIHALKEVGLYSRIKANMVAMPGRMLHDEEGSLQYQPYGPNKGDVHFSISRGALNKFLLDAAEATGKVSIFFNENCTELNLAMNRLRLTNATTGKSRWVYFEAVIGTDGVRSAICSAMVEERRVRCRHEYLPHGYKELCIPAHRNGRYRMERNALHIWPRGGYMLIALPNDDGSFTATLFLPYSGPESFESLTNEHRVQDFFAARYP